MKLSNMIGYKLFKTLDDESILMIRIIKVHTKRDGSNPKYITVRDEDTGNIYEESVENLKEWTPLEPDGFATFNIVSLKDQEGKEVKDVVVTGSKFLNMKIGDTLPYCICRQNITDIFYNLLCKDESDMIVGLSVNRDTCPANFDYGLMLACSDITYSIIVNFYRTDLVTDLLDMIPKLKFNTVLNDLYMTHMVHSGKLSSAGKNQDKGWCNNIATLLKENNFQEDINQMLGITSINPVIKDHMVTKTLPNGEEYSSFDDDMKLWLASIYKIAFNDITVLEFDHDINLAEFNNAKYLLLRDGTNKLYLVVYTTEGLYHESDLEAIANKKDFSTEFRINFYNKYNNSIQAKNKK